MEKRKWTASDAEAGDKLANTITNALNTDTIRSMIGRLQAHVGDQ